MTGSKNIPVRISKLQNESNAQINKDSTHKIKYPINPTI